MDFTVPEEIEMLRQTLRRFVTEEVIPLDKEHPGCLAWEEVGLDEL